MKNIRYYGYLMVFLLLLIPVFSIFVQSSFVSCGKSIDNVNGSLSYSVGQNIISTVNGSTGIVSHGVQQPFEIYEILNINETLISDYNVFFYPNPSQEILNIEVKGDVLSTMEVTLFDINGKEILVNQLNNNKISLNISSLPNAVYFLKISNYNQSKGTNESKAFKIVKN